MSHEEYKLKCQERRMYENLRNSSLSSIEDCINYQEKVNKCNQEIKALFKNKKEPDIKKEKRFGNKN